MSEYPELKSLLKNTSHMSESLELKSFLKIQLMRFLSNCL